MTKTPSKHSCPRVRILSTPLTLALGMALTTACASDAPIGSTASCADCDITLEHIGQISDDSALGDLPSESTHVTVDSAGRIFIVSKGSNAVLVYSPDGTLLHRLGTLGEGPGEVGPIRRVFIGAGDSIYISDWGLRVTVFAPDFSYVRVQRVKTYPALMLGNGTFVVAEKRRSVGGASVSGASGHPIDVLGADGAVRISFGGDTTRDSKEQVEIGRDLLFANQLAAPARNGDLWSVAPGRYTLERWDAQTGLRKQSTPIRSDWFKETAVWPKDPQARPPAIIESLWEDRDGLVWFLFRDADLEWKKPSLESVQDREEGPVTDYASFFDWILEAVDPATGEVLASKRVSHILWEESRPMLWYHR